jgi:aspartyl protease family protein
MRYLLYFCISLFALVALTGKLAGWVGYTPGKNAEQAHAETTAAAPKPAKAKTRNDILVVGRGRNGHFDVDAVIGGRRVNFLVDTGASIIALTAEDAARLGIKPSARDRVARMETANGIVLARHVRLASVEIGSLLVQDVDAVVMPAGKLSQNLLGMSFLSRLRRYEFRSGQLVMEQ